MPHPVTCPKRVAARSRRPPAQADRPPTLTAHPPAPATCPRRPPTSADRPPTSFARRRRAGRLPRAGCPSALAPICVAPIARLAIGHPPCARPPNCRPTRLDFGRPCPTSPCMATPHLDDHKLAVRVLSVLRSANPRSIAGAHPPRTGCPANTIALACPDDSSVPEHRQMRLTSSDCPICKQTTSLITTDQARALQVRHTSPPLYFFLYFPHLSQPPSGPRLG